MQWWVCWWAPEFNDPIVRVWLVAGPWQVRGGPVAAYGWRDVTLLCARSRVVVGGWEWFQGV